MFASHSWDPLLKQDAYFLEFQVKVIDPDGVPGNIDRVYATLPNETTVDLVYDERISDTEAYYYAYRRFDAIAHIIALEGNFTFTVVDVNTGSATTPADNLSGVTANMLAGAVIPVTRAGCLADVDDPHHILGAGRRRR